MIMFPVFNSFSFLFLDQDVPLISLANIFQNARLWEDALTVARMAVEIAPHFVVNHFTLANVYIAMVRSNVKLYLNLSKSPSLINLCVFFIDIFDNRRSLKKPCTGTSLLWSYSRSSPPLKIDCELFSVTFSPRGSAVSPEPLPPRDHKVLSRTLRHTHRLTNRLRLKPQIVCVKKNKKIKLTKNKRISTLMLCWIEVCLFVFFYLMLNLPLRFGFGLSECNVKPFCPTTAKLPPIQIFWQ